MPGSGTQSQFAFSMVPSVRLQRSAFDRSHTVKTTFDFGQLIPIFVDEALPGDTLSLRLNTFGRMATMIHPIAENLYMDFFFFAIPNRLVWDNWQRMMGEQRNPGDSIDFKVPQLNPGTSGFGENSLGDYFGLPTKVNLAPQSSWPSALPFRSYALVYNEWFRDENLQNSVVVSTDDGPDLQAEYPLLKRGKRHDYFTSALPFAQKGPAIALPLGQLAPVIPATPAVSPQFVFAPRTQAVLETAGSTSSGSPVLLSNLQQAGQTGVVAAGADLQWGTTTGLVTNLAAATAVTVNTLREAVATQRLLERDARGGTRYVEILRSHFGVISPDARLQRPEYLGGGTAKINVNPIAATNAGTFADGGGPGVDINFGIGTLGGMGTTSARGIGFSKSFTEHCVLLGLVAARADLNYQQGMERMWSRRNRYDFYWPEFATLGEQPVKNKEIFQSSGSVLDTGVDEQTFGFQERYAEYRYKPSRVTGRMRSNSSTTLESWHLAQDFAALPALNPAFIEENPDVARVLVVATGEPQLLLDCFFSYRCVRPMPTYAIPGLGGRL